jgi:hypothetical protein
MMEQEKNPNKTQQPNPPSKLYAAEGKEGAQAVFAGFYSKSFCGTDVL